MTHVLIIDDEDVFREDLAELLRQQTYDCSTAADGEAGVRIAEADAPDILLCDLMLPGINGLETMRRICTTSPETRAIMLTAHAALETAVEAFRRGAVDYLLKPVVPLDVLQKVARCVELRKMQQELTYLRREISETATGTTLVGESPAMRSIKEAIARVGKSRTSVLVTGESGTGKELVARALHETYRGSKAPFMAVNCSALPRDLLESELFGYVRGAFTGAGRDKPGYFELSDGGTLFLDELCEMPLESQPKLLRAVEQQEIVPLGTSRPRHVDVRIVAATNRDIRKEIDEGRFREDLYFRLSVVNIHLPPLRDRREDIPLIVQHLLRRLNRKLNRNVTSLSNDAMRALMGANWRGNVREVENVLERALLLAEDNVITMHDLPPELTSEMPVANETSRNLRLAIQAYEREHIRQVLEATSWNREEAARLLGVNPSTLYRRMRRLSM